MTTSELVVSYVLMALDLILFKSFANERLINHPSKSLLNLSPWWRPSDGTNEHPNDTTQPPDIIQPKDKNIDTKRKNEGCDCNPECQCSEDTCSGINACCDECECDICDPDCDCSCGCKENECSGDKECCSECECGAGPYELVPDGAESLRYVYFLYDGREDDDWSTMKCHGCDWVIESGDMNFNDTTQEGLLIARLHELREVVKKVDSMLSATLIDSKLEKIQGDFEALFE